MSRVDDRDADLLFELVRCHSTPGDEDEVAVVLLREWTAAGLETAQHGPYAISARLPRCCGVRRPVMLVCAHMDSPGFIVERVGAERLKVIPLGTPKADPAPVSVAIKTKTERVSVPLTVEADEEEGRTEYYVPAVAGVRPGDRLCFPAIPRTDAGQRVRAPFLDNRLGCALLCRAAGRLARNGEFEVVLGATACEEMGGFGAPVLAEAVRPDLVLCVDATYADADMSVHLGRGPVLTLSDASVLLAPKLRDRVAGLLDGAGIPLQTEVYNYSGTDSRAFPHHGLPAPVLALLIATEGNHSPEETADLNDLVDLAGAVQAIAATGVSAGLLAGSLGA